MWPPSSATQHRLQPLRRAASARDAAPCQADLGVQSDGALRKRLRKPLRRAQPARVCVRRAGGDLPKPWPAGTPAAPARRRGPDPGPRVATRARAAAGSAPRRRCRARARRPPPRQLLGTRGAETFCRLPPPDRRPRPRQPPPRAAPRRLHVVCHRRRRSGDPQRRLPAACPCLASCCAERESLPDKLLPLRPLTTPGDCPSQWLPELGFFEASGAPGRALRHFFRA